MNHKLSNPLLKQLISEISNKANSGRINDLSWGAIYEARKKKSLKKEADEKKKDPSAEDQTADTPDAKPDVGGDLPPLGGPDETPKDAKATDTKPAADSKEPSKADIAPTDGGEPDAEEADKAKEDAAKAKAELEKAKAEKAQAEKEIEKQQYVKLSSSSGTQFLLSKILDHAFKSNTIDALAGEMVDKLKIQTPDDMNAFSEDVVTYMNIPGMPELLSSMKTLASKKPETTEEPSA